MSHISLTVPSDDKKALVAGATMLLTLAGKIPEMELPDEGECAGAAINTKWPLSEPVAPPPSPEATEEASVDHVWTGPKLDADGLPWDARIHSGSKAILQDGTWRKKRGVDKEDYDRVVEELKQLMAAPVVMQTHNPDAGEPAAAIAPPPPAEVAGPLYWIDKTSGSYGEFDGKEDLEEVQKEYPSSEQVDQATYAQFVSAAETPNVPVPPPPAAAEVPVPDTFPAFLKAVTMMVQAKELTIEQINDILRPHGVVNLQGLGVRTDLIPQVWADLVARQ